MNKIFIQKTFKICSLFILIALVSCSNLTLPKKITIQADPEIQASFGSIETSLTDYFSIEKIQEMMGEDEAFKIHDYKHNANDNTLRFLASMDFSMPIDGLDVDGNLQELENMDPIIFGYEEDGVTPSTLFSVPEINQTIEIDPISLEFNDEIRNSIKDTFSAISFSAVEPGTVGLENQNLPLLIELCDDEFDTITFGSGTTLDLSFLQLSDFTTGLTAKINSISLFDASKVTDEKSIAEGAVVNQTKVNSISQSESIVFENTNIDIITGSNLDVSIDMEGKTVPKDICIVLNVTFRGGTQGKSVTINTSETKFSNMNVTKVTGFTTIDPIEVDFPALNPIDLSTELNDIKGATIGSDSEDGKILFEFTNLPEGITPTTTLSLAQDSDTYNAQTYLGLNVSNQLLIDNKISLAGQNLNTKPINLTGSLSIEAENATIDFTKAINIDANVEINKFAEVHILDSLILADVLTQNYSYSLASIAEYVTSIKFNEVGLALKLCNGLPFDATMKITSSFLSKDNEEYIFTGNQTELPTEAKKIVSGSQDTPHEKDITDTTEFDLAINIEMQSSNGVITLQNISSGTDYKFFGQADLIIDWESVFFKLPDEYSGFKGSFPEDGSDPIDFSALGNVLGENLVLSGAEPKLYLSSELLADGGALEGATITAKMKATYTENETPITEYLVGSDSEYLTLDIVDTPNLVPDENSLITGALPQASVDINNFDKILSSGASDLKIEYDFSLGGSTSEGSLETGIEIKKSQVENLKGNSEISICMLIDLPIQFTVLKNDKEYASFNIAELMNQNSETEEGESEEDSTETDLFNRAPNEDATESDFDVFEFINSVKLGLYYQNDTGIALELVISDKNAQGKTFNKTATLSKGKGNLELSLTEDDAIYIKNTNPFNPDVLELRLPGSKEKDTVYNINRNANLNITLQGSIQTDIDYTIDLANPENTEGEN